MKDHCFKILGLIVVLTSAVSDRAFAASLPDRAYFGQTPPGLTPQIFAPGLISLSNRRETKVVFSTDGQESFIAVGGSSFTILYTKQVNGHWSDPVTPSFIGAGDAREPFLSPDGQKLFFIRNMDIYASTRVNQTWSNPQLVNSPISTSAEEWHPSVTSDGTIYFTSSRNNPSGYYNIYRSEYVNGSYSTVERLSTTINSSYGAWDPFIAPDESYMIFCSQRPDGYGNVDQYISHNVNGAWSNPQNLGSPINTSNIEYVSYISPDNKYFFFSRPAGWGPGIAADIYWVDARALGIPEPSLIVLLAAGGLCLPWFWSRR